MSTTQPRHSTPLSQDSKPCPRVLLLWEFQLSSGTWNIEGFLHWDRHEGEKPLAEDVILEFFLIFFSLFLVWPFCCVSARYVWKLRARSGLPQD